MYARSVGLQNLRDQEPQLSVAEQCDPIAFWDLDLIQDLAGRGYGFDEYGVFGRYRLGNPV
jgi:hypothetical protein